MIAEAASAAAAAAVQPMQGILPPGAHTVRFEDGSIGVIRQDANGRSYNDVAAARQFQLAGSTPQRIEVPVHLDGRVLTRVVLDHTRREAYAGVG